MIIPDDKVPQDDLQNQDKDEQRSQQDLHSNGFDEYNEPLEQDNVDESDALGQAYDAAEPSYTINLDDDDDKDED